MTNDVQIAYSQTEGYAPVTSKAQQSEVYKDYLSRAGEDNDFYYDVKMEATNLLLENTGNTFVTPVFSGSASLRDAAGQMIENVTKSVRRKKVVDAAFIEDLFADVTSLYRLDQIGASSGGAGLQEDLGPLPATSKALLATLGVTWILIAVYVISDFIKQHRRKK